MAQLFLAADSVLIQIFFQSYASTIYSKLSVEEVQETLQPPCYRLHGSLWLSKASGHQSDVTSSWCLGAVRSAYPFSGQLPTNLYPCRFQQQVQVEQAMPNRSSHPNTTCQT